MNKERTIGTIWMLPASTFSKGKWGDVELVQMINSDPTDDTWEVDFGVTRGFDIESVDERYREYRQDPVVGYISLSIPGKYLLIFQSNIKGCGVQAGVIAMDPGSLVQLAPWMDSWARLFDEDGTISQRLGSIEGSLQRLLTS